MDARSLMSLFSRGFGMTTLDGHKQYGMTADEFRDGASSVNRDDLRAIGVGSKFADPNDASGMAPVDPERMKFDAMLALKKAQASGMPTSYAQKRLEEAELFSAGREEVLRRRQADFNTAARDPGEGRYSPLVGSGPDPKITALTGAAHASQARAGKPQLTMPQEQRPMSMGDWMQSNPSKVLNPMGSNFTAPDEPEAPYVLDQNDMTGGRRTSKNAPYVMGAMAGLGRARRGGY